MENVSKFVTHYYGPNRQAEKLRSKALSQSVHDEKVTKVRRVSNSENLTTGGSLQLRLYGGVRPHFWKIDPSGD